jgi:hypothetical protein
MNQVFLRFDNQKSQDPRLFPCSSKLQLHPAVVIGRSPGLKGFLRLKPDRKRPVAEAWSSAMMFRGLEILRTRSPGRLIIRNTSGVYYSPLHLLLRAVEDALGITIPDNARLLLDLLEGAHSSRIM